MTSTLHGICHSKSGPLRLHLLEGQCSGFTGADGVLKVGDQGYERDKIRKMLARQGIPPRRCRKQPVHDHKRLDRRRPKSRRSCPG